MENFLAQFMPMDGSAHGPQLDRINALVHLLMLVIFVGWSLYFVYVLYRFRAKQNARASYHGTRTHISHYAEAGVAIVEVVLLLVFSIPAWYQWRKIPPRAENPLVVRVNAEQFAWNVHYPGPDGLFGKTSVNLVGGSNPVGLDLTDPQAKDDIVAVNQLHVELNRPVIVHLTAKDVIHSFGLPNMRVKQDAIPGFSFAVHFTPVKAAPPGQKWEIACAQLCGLGHYRMRGFFSVDTKEQLQEFFAANAPQPMS